MLTITIWIMYTAYLCKQMLVAHSATDKKTLFGTVHKKDKLLCSTMVASRCLDGTDAMIHAFLNSSIYEVNGQLHASIVLTIGKDSK
jgi:hypothetical protein